MFLKPFCPIQKPLNTIWTSDGRLNIWSARQVRKTTQRFKVKVALTYADSSSLPLVLQIFKGHPLFTMITIQNKGKGLEVVASPADPRLQRYVSFNNGLEIWIHTISIFQQDQTSEEESWLRDHLMSFHYESTNWKMWWKLKNSQWNIQFV